MKKIICLSIAFLIIVCFSGCQTNNNINRTNSLEENESNILEETPSINIDDSEDSLTTEKCESILKEMHEEIISLPFHRNDNQGTSYYSINSGNVMFKTNSNFVEYINLEKNGYKIGVYFGDNAVLETQKIRLYLRSGFMSYPDLTLNEQYIEMVSLLEGLKIYEGNLPKFEEFEENIKLTSNPFGGKHYEYVFNNNIKFMVEESIKNGQIEDRTIFCDVY